MANTKKPANAGSRKGKALGPGKRPSVPDEIPLELSWNLAELPSAQHKTGLAGLVLMVRWLKRQPKRKGLCELTRLDADGAAIRVDRVGLRELFDETYAATEVEREEGKVRKHRRTKAEIRPLRIVEHEVKDERGKLKKQTMYVYPATEPKGAFLADLDDPSGGKSGLWIRMWRSFMWTVLRARDAQRGPYKARAAGCYSEDADEVFEQIRAGAERRIDLASTYFIGAQAVTAENVPFADRVRFRFLLHFWPFAVGIYVPAIVDHENNPKFLGYALAFPDLADLATGCDEIERVLKDRGSTEFKYLPAEAVVDLPAESALDFAARLFKRVAANEGQQGVADLLLGVDVLHVEREEHNVWIRGSARVEPTTAMTDEYETLRERYRDPTFRRQILANHLAARPRHSGFDRLFQTRDYNLFFAREGSYFKHDARAFFVEDDREAHA